MQKTNGHMSKISSQTKELKVQKNLPGIHRVAVSLETPLSDTVKLKDDITESFKVPRDTSIRDAKQALYL